MTDSTTSDTPSLTASAPVARVAEDIAVPATPESLIAKLRTYLEPDQIEAVRRAYDYAAHAHAGQVRRTGHPYITHPLAVADILAGMHMDPQALMAALLHDVIEDTNIAKATLSEAFDPEVADLVDGMSKLKNIFHSRDEAQAENFSRMALAMGRDIRVILIKLADRMHNMRTLGALAAEKRRRIAKETLEFYAPIANRLGMNQFRVEFEDLAFAAMYPMRSARIGKAVKVARRNRRTSVDGIRTSIAEALRREGIDAVVTSREKHLYSIYRKMRAQRKSFSQIIDVFGCRIVVDTIDTCYRALGIVHNLYPPVAGRFKDYIAIPKANGYQSLHTALFLERAVPIEVQIRTRDMDQVANNGIAGHRLYKADDADGSGGGRASARARQFALDIVDLQQRATSPAEFIENLKVDLFPDEVYVFTPHGKILSLPRHATPVDFAYAVHTEVGNRCVSCTVDGVPTSLSTELESGQNVEIATAREARPRPDWLEFVVTSKARMAIKHALKNQQASESVALGRRLLNRALATEGRNIKDFDFRRLRKVFKEFGVRRLNDLLVEIGLGNRMAVVVARRLLSGGEPEDDALAVDQGGPVSIKGSEGLVTTYAKCCHPLPGDAIVGFMATGKGLTVHVETCGNMNEIRRRSPEKIIPVRWAERVQGEFTAELRAEVRRQHGVIAQLAAAANAVEAGIANISVVERNAHLSILQIALYVKSRTHLARVLRKMRAIPVVSSIRRSIS